MSDSESRMENGEIGAESPRLYYACHTFPIRPLDEIEKVLDQHVAYLSSLERSGKLLLAGPLFSGSSQYDGEGLIIFAASSHEEAQKLASADPFHAQGIRDYTLNRWQVNEGILAARLS